MGKSLVSHTKKNAFEIVVLHVKDGMEKMHTASTTAYELLQRGARVVSSLGCLPAATI